VYFILAVTMYRQFCRRCHIVKMGSQADQRTTFRFVRGIRDNGGFPRKNLFPRFLHPLLCDIVAHIRDIGVPRGLREFPVVLGVFEICSSALILRLVFSFDTICIRFFYSKMKLHENVNFDIGIKKIIWEEKNQLFQSFESNFYKKNF